MQLVRSIISMLSFIFLLDLSVSAQKPNVLFIAIDDLGVELNCYGQTEAKTPNIDRLASQGILFEKAFCNIPTCGASRASLMTSIYPTKNRFKSFSTKVHKDTPGAVTLPQIFRENGYKTLSRGKVFHHSEDCEGKSWSEPAWRPEIPFRYWLDPDSTKILSKGGSRGLIYERPRVDDLAYADGQIAAKVIQDLQESKDKDEPFFIACGFVKPHLPFCAPRKYWEKYDQASLMIAKNRYRPQNAPLALKGSSEFRKYYLGGLKPQSEEFHRIMVHGYRACVSYIDQLVGNILLALNELNLEKNTIVVLWGDHGFHLGQHDFWGKHNTLLHSIQIPFIMKVPGINPARSESLIETVDIFPTLCDIVGIEKPNQIQGISFKKTLNDPQYAPREHIYSRFKSGQVILNPPFSYTQYQDGSSLLFNHQDDSGENINLAQKPEYSTLIGKMKQKLDLALQKADSAKW